MISLGTDDGITVAYLSLTAKFNKHNVPVSHMNRFGYRLIKQHQIEHTYMTSCLVSLFHEFLCVFVGCSLAGDPFII